MIDRASQVISFLRKHVDTLQAQGAHIVQADALGYLQSGRPLNSTPQNTLHSSLLGKEYEGVVNQQETSQTTFDIVFLDPPFRHNLLEPCCQWLEHHLWLTPQARIYLEAESALSLPVLPQNWRITHSKRAGEVSYYLAVRG